MKASEVGRWLASLVVFVVTGAAHGQQSGTLDMIGSKSQLGDRTHVRTIRRGRHDARQ